RPQLGKQLTDVGDAHAELRLLQVRPAAGGVDNEDVQAGEQLADPVSTPAPLRLPAGMEVKRTATLLIPERNDLAPLGGKHPGGCRVDVAEDDPLDAAEQEPDARPALSDRRR